MKNVPICSSKDDYDFITNYIDSHKTTDEDLLIQLADSLANKNGVVTLEQRAKEYSERHNIEIPQEMIEPRYKLKAYFDNKVGCDVYGLFQNQHGNQIYFGTIFLLLSVHYCGNSLNSLL